MSCKLNFYENGQYRNQGGIKKRCAYIGQPSLKCSANYEMYTVAILYLCMDGSLN